MLKKHSNRSLAGPWPSASHWLGVVIALLMLGHLSVQAQTNQGSARSVRTILPSEWDVPYPAGIAYSGELGQLFMLDKKASAPPATTASIVAITPLEQLIGTVQLNFAVDDAINLTYADAGRRLFLLNRQNAHLAQVQIGADGLLDAATLIQFDVAWFGLVNPQGLSVDAAQNQLYILDSTPPRLIRASLNPTTGFDESQVSIINLAKLGVANVRGIAVHPLNHHLYIGSPTDNKLYELTSSGQAIASYDLAALQLVDQRGLLFAPSADLTDPPETTHLFVADSNLPTLDQTPPTLGKIVEAALTCTTCGTLTQTLTVTVASGNDDAEERNDGSVDLDSSDLEMIQDGNRLQTVGLRFSGVTVPAGANILHAYVEFTTDEAASAPTSLVIRGEAADNAVAFADLPHNLSSRAMTSAAISWSNPAPWKVVGERQRTPDLGPLLQEIVQRPGWQSGNSLALIISGAGQRVAKSADGDAASAPRLLIEYRAP